MAHGRYTIVGKLADGGMAEIFLAMQHGAEGFQKPVVMKRVLSAFSADPQFRNMFLDEAHISMTLAHGNIVQVLDVGVAGERTFLVLELVEGWDLDQIMERAQATGPDHPWPPSLALYVTAQICRGLAYAHGKRGQDGRPLGIVHRDVSPTNVLISEQGEVKLADFGIAKAERKREQTLAGVIKGKIGFMSPEQALGRPLDARADLFSVGTVMYLMLTGQRPFGAGSELESMLRAQRAEYRPPEELNPYLSREATKIVGRAMQREPADRYQTADQMLVEVERVLRSEYHSAGQTELKLWLADLARRDGVPPIGRARLADDDSARPVFVDAGGDLSVGSSVELSDIDGSAAATAVSLPLMGSGQPDPAKLQIVLKTPVSAPAMTPGQGAAVFTAPVGTADAVTAVAPPTVSAIALPVVDPGRTARDSSAPTAPTTTFANRRMPRRSRVGLGFILGALCMLGAVFGIRWLAQWAGREEIVVSRWVPLSGEPPLASGLPAPPSSAHGSRDPEAPGSGARSPQGNSATVVAPPASLVRVPVPVDPSTTAAAVDAAVAIAGDRDAQVSPVTGANELEDDEDRLLGRVVPDAATVIGEDEAEQKTTAKPGKAEAKPSVRAAGPVETSGAKAQVPRSTDRSSRDVEAEKARLPARPQTKPAPRAQPVQIRITTSPLGAVVRTKKQVLGRTPLAVRFNPGNTYELTFVKRGYVTNSRRLAVNVGKPQSISVAMKKAPPPPKRGFFRGR